MIKIQKNNSNTIPKTTKIIKKKQTVRIFGKLLQNTDMAYTKDKPKCV